MIGQKCENTNSLISGVDDETGFEYVESKVAAGYLDVAVQWQIQVGQKAANALKEKHGTNYRVGSSADIL
ncbi:hypothetical protein MC885_005847 [Smutsia gigantea]|nr:hypothetical protein MC885_005847 [Smutsia gigantea]